MREPALLVGVIGLWLIGLAQLLRVLFKSASGWGYQVHTTLG
jgi:hypothetical protein